MGQATTALVTGASSGIGKAFAAELAARGDAVILVARDGERLERQAAELREQHGVDVEVLAADLTADEGVRAVEARLASAAAPVDRLVNNAGMGTVGPFAGLPIETELREIALNVTAVVRLSHAALGAMVERGQGGLINVSSVAGVQPTPLNATYGATKAFVTSFTESLHEEAKGTGVRVTVLCPGYTRTEFQERAGIDSSRVPEFLWMPAERVAADGLRANDAGKAVFVPGVANRVAATFSSMSPHTLSRKLAGAVIKRSE